MGMVCSMCGKGMNFFFKILVENVEERDHLRDIGIEGGGGRT